MKLLVHITHIAGGRITGFFENEPQTLMEECRTVINGGKPFLMLANGISTTLVPTAVLTDSTIKYEEVK